MVISIKAMLTVEGNVQAVGYRALVKQTARSLGVKGKVKNLDNGGVEIYCEGDKKSILKLQKQINIKSKEPENVFSLNVKKIHRFFEDEDGYKDPGEEFKLFWVDYGEEAKAPDMANLERLEIGSIMMLNLGKEVKTVGTEIKEGFSKTHQDFHELDGKYDVVSHELKSMNNNISKLVDHLGTIIDQFVENKKKLNTHKGQ